MMDFLVENYLSLIMGGLIAGLWSVAHDRRKAVDRLWDAIGETWSDRDCPDNILAWRCGCRERIIGYISLRSDDAPGRMIARSVKRMTKEKP